MAGLVALSLLLLFLTILPTSSSFKSNRFTLHRTSQRISGGRGSLHIMKAGAKSSIGEDSVEGGDSKQMNNAKVNVPFRGLAGYESNSLFEEPIEIPNTTTNFKDLPGEDGSDEKIRAIQQRIQQRVDELAKAGPITDDETDPSFGGDPLTEYSLLQLMMMQVKSAKIFDSVDEMFLTLSLVIITIVALSTYTVVLEYGVTNFVQWFLKTDFDADFLQKAIGNVKS